MISGLNLRHRDTAYLLNYLTLKISDDEIANLVERERTEYFNRLIWPTTVFAVFFFL